MAVTAPELKAGAGVAEEKGGEETPGDRHLAPRSRRKASAHVRRYGRGGSRGKGGLWSADVTTVDCFGDSKAISIAKVSRMTITPSFTTNGEMVPCLVVHGLAGSS